MSEAATEPADDDVELDDDDLDDDDQSAADG